MARPQEVYIPNGDGTFSIYEYRATVSMPLRALAPWNQTLVPPENGDLERAPLGGPMPPLPGQEGARPSKSPVAHLLAGADAPYITSGSGELIPGTELKVDDPCVRYVALPRKDYSRKVAREIVARLLLPARRKPRLMHLEGAEFWTFSIAPDSSFADPPQWGIVRAQAGIVVAVGQPRKASAAVTNVPRYQPFETAAQGDID